jgi:hypothetical protein
VYGSKAKIEDKMNKILLIVALVIFSSSNVLASGITDVKAKNIAAKTTNLKPSLARIAIEAFYKAKKQGIRISKPIITVIDYSLPSTKNRLWVLDVSSNRVLYTSMVAHGKHSGENNTTSFSNKVNSLQTSLGLFLTDTTYFGRDGYSLRIKGLEKGFNDNAESRYIVLHGAPYVSKAFANAAGRIGRSWGCPAVEKPLAKPIINTIKEGTLILAFYPNKTWLNNSRFID